MNGIESLPEPQEILIVAIISWTAAAVTIERVRRAGDRTESHVFIADDYVSLRVARVQREALRRETDLRFDERGIEAHAVRPGIDVRAGLAEDRLGLVVEDIDADFLQYRERGSMNGFELVSRDELDGRKPRARLGRGRDRRDTRSPPRRRRRGESSLGPSFDISRVPAIRVRRAVDFVRSTNCSRRRPRTPCAKMALRHANLLIVVANGSLGRSQPRRLGCRALAFARLVGRETRYEP